MLSIVISHKNRMVQLQKCINFLIEQKTTYEYEIIVVDGGSDEKIIKKLYELEKNTKIQIYYFKDKEFNVSKYRNYGVKKSKGTIITFLDADIIVPNDFVENICKKYMNSHEFVLIHTAYGFRINIYDKLAEMFNEITSKNIKEVIKIMEFSDFRDSALEFYDIDFNQCCAPWVYGWSGIISISKDLLIKSGLFDENFIGWGSEDTDLAYRIWLKGGNFIYERDAFGIHVAHESNKNQKENQNYLNRRFLYSKYKTFETELYAFLTGVSINNILQICKHIHLGALNPIYTTEQIEKINKITINKKSLCVGLNSYQELSRLYFTDYLVINEKSEKVIKKVNKKANCKYRLGLITDYDDQYFDVCIIFDSYNLLPQNLYKIFINEMKRISKKVYQIKTVNFQPVTYNKIGKMKENTNSELKELFL